MLVQPLSGFRSIGEVIAAEVVDRQYERQPELEQRFGRAGREKCHQDACFHIAYLLEAVDQRSPEIFLAYTTWVKTLLQGRGISERDLAEHLGILREVVARRLPAHQRDAALSVLDATVAKLPILPVRHTSCIRDDWPLSGLARSYLTSLIDRRRMDAIRMIRDALAGGTSVRDIYLHVFQPVLREIGRLWQIGQISVAQEHYSTAVTQLIMSDLYSHVLSEDRIGKTFVAACVGDELHEIGVRMVSDFMELEGWDTIYLGANLPASEIVGAVTDSAADAVGLSVTLPFHIERATNTISLLRADPHSASIFVIVGGYAFGEGGGSWQMTGADAFAADASEAVRIFRQANRAR